PINNFSVEEQFIQKKIEESFKDKNYYVVFVPTCIYDLFCINEYLSQRAPNMWADVGSRPIHIDLKPILNKTYSPAEIRKKIMAQYVAVNDKFFQGNPSIFVQLNSSLGEFLLNT